MYDRLIRRLEQTGVLSEAETKALKSLHLRPRVVQARTEIDTGASPESVHLILSGIACRYKLWADGERRIVSLLVPGDLCDGHAPMPFVFQSRVAALTACKIADIPRQTMLELIQNYPRIERALWWITLVKLSASQAWLANIGRKADKRIAYFFCELLARLQAVDLADDNSCEFDLTQTDLAEIFGLSTVHVNRVLQSMRRIGLIALENRRLTIPDVEKLRRFAEFDFSYLSGRLAQVEAEVKRLERARPLEEHLTRAAAAV